MGLQGMVAGGTAVVRSRAGRRVRRVIHRFPGPGQRKHHLLGLVARTGWPPWASLCLSSLVSPWFSLLYFVATHDHHSVPGFKPPTEAAPWPNSQERGSALASWSGVPRARQLW